MTKPFSSNGRPAGCSAKGGLLRAWYEAFLTDTLRCYPDVDDLPTSFSDFDYVWSTFQTSNRKLRGTVVELTDFERETVLEYLRDQLGVLDFDAAAESIVWRPDELEKATGDKPASQRRPWSQATNDWGAPVQTPKDHSQVEELFWGPAPAQGPIDPAWQISWSGDTPSPPNPTPSSTRHQPQGDWARTAAASNIPGRNGSSRGKIEDIGRRSQTEQRLRPAPRSSSGPSEPPPKRAVQQPPPKRPTQPAPPKPSVQQPGKQHDWSASVKRDSKKVSRQEPPVGKQKDWSAVAKRSSMKETRSEPPVLSKPAVISNTNKKEAKLDSSAREKKSSMEKLTSSSAVANQPTRQPNKKDSMVSKTPEKQEPKPPQSSEETPTWKTESSEKTGSGMALLGFDYL